MFEAFVGYYQGNGHMIIDQTQIFDTEQEAENWLEFMLNMDSQYDVTEIKEIDNFEAQVEEFEAQEEARLELGIPQGIF